jgi:hypothetical protein
MVMVDAGNRDREEGRTMGVPGVSPPAGGAVPSGPFSCYSYDTMLRYSEVMILSVSSGNRP